VYVAEKLVTAERRWVVSGTPARDRLYGIEVDLASTADDLSDFDDGFPSFSGRIVISTLKNGAEP
jgi:hypothetical protein